MRIIDRYLLRQYFQVLLVSQLSLTGLYVVIDAFGHLDEFVQATEGGVSMLALLGEYYGYHSLAFFDRTSGILALISAMFTVTWLQRHNEMTALLAAGIPKRRIVISILGAACGVSLLAAANREILMPHIRKGLQRTSQQVAGSAGKDLRPQIDRDTRIHLSGGRILAKDKRIEEPSFLLPISLDRYGEELAARVASFQDADPETGQPQGYRLKGVRRPKNLRSRPSIRQHNRIVVFSPHDTDWLRENECFVLSSVHPETLAASEGNYSSTWELIQNLKNGSTSFNASMRVAIHLRLVQPLSDATLLLLGLPLVLSRHTRNPFLAIGTCLLVVVGYMLVVLVCQFLGSNGIFLTPALAAWMPLVLFVPAAAVFAEPLFE